MIPDEEDAKPSFADLIGETRPVKGKRNQIAPTQAANSAANPSTNPAARSTSPRMPQPGDASRDGAARNRFRWPDPEEPRRAAAPGVSDRQLADLGRGDPAPEERIDLHGVRAEAAKRLLIQRLASARSRGLRCVLLIHGKGTKSADGDSVLRERVPAWLSGSIGAKSVQAFAPAPAKLGGAGALLVLLKRA